MVKLPTPEKFHFDKRTLKRNTEKGLIKDIEIEKHLKSLPDETAQADKVAIWEEGQYLPSERMKTQPSPHSSSSSLTKGKGSQTTYEDDASLDSEQQSDNSSQGSNHSFPTSNL